MSNCINCGNPLSASDKFCSCCGAKVPEVRQEVPVQPVRPAQNDQYYYSAVKPAQVELSRKDKVFGFVGMGLSIGGVFMAALGLIYTMIGMIETGAGFAISLIFGMFSVPLSIVGLKLTRRSKDAGNTSGTCTAGTATGIAGIAVSGLMAFLGFINLFV